TTVWKYVKRPRLIFDLGRTSTSVRSRAAPSRFFFPFDLAGVCSGGGSLEMLTPHAAPRQVATNSALKQRNESDRLMWIGFGTPSARLRLPPHARPGGKV
ncbi:MAG: hypothetical protein ACPIOQ_81565, partial [Promethearchaeia archaeon]